MKKGVLLTGLVAAILIFVGIVFKNFHWPGAGVLLTLGGALGIVFLIIYLASATKLLQSGLEKTNGIIAAIVFIIILAGFTFKMQHWPGAGVLIILSNAGLILSSILMFADAFYEKKDTKKAFKGLIGFLYFILMSILFFLSLVN